MIGTDVYDHGWAPGWQDPETRWREIRDQPYGLAWQRAFAAAHGKPTSLPEWGVVKSPHGGGDNPGFIRHMHDWIAAGNVEYSAYFEADTSTPIRLMTGNFPRAAAEFRRLFGPGEAPAGPATTVPAPSAPVAAPPPAAPASAPAPQAPASSARRRSAAAVRTRWTRARRSTRRTPGCAARNSSVAVRQPDQAS